MEEALPALMLNPAMFMDRAKYRELSKQWSTEVPKKSRVTRMTVKKFNLTKWLLDETLRKSGSHLWREFRDVQELRAPAGGNKLKKVMDQYARLGFAGAVESTHTPWGKCPVELFHQCKGKEGYPSLAFEMVVDHKRRYHNCTEAYHGALPDATIACDNEYMSSILEGYYKDVAYSLYGSDGQFTTFKSGYLISDGG
ncbi:hypothetical protein B484DRAFT_461688, partial [Ochromonadaceae sp. CCMP2298]